MLYIRQAQMDAFTTAFVADFERAAVVELQEQYPERCEALGDGGCQKLVHYGVEKARGFGITKEYDVQAFVDLMFAYSADFELSPELGWTKAVLDEADLDGTTKMAVILRRVGGRESR